MYSITKFQTCFLKMKKIYTDKKIQNSFRSCPWIKKYKSQSLQEISHSGKAAELTEFPARAKNQPSIHSNTKNHHTSALSNNFLAFVRTPPCKQIK